MESVSRLAQVKRAIFGRVCTFSIPPPENLGYCLLNLSWSQAAIAQLAARRSHNPKVMSSILTRRIFGSGITRLVAETSETGEALRNSGNIIHETEIDLQQTEPQRLTKICIRPKPAHNRNREV